MSKAERMKLYEIIIVGVLSLSFRSNTYSQEADGQNSARKELRAAACFMGYPHAMLFHTGFHGGYTTRFTLLKRALDSKELAEFFDLSESQLGLIRELKPVKIEATDGSDGEANGNDSPDEDVIDPDRFRFLAAAQKTKLDAIAFRFDGFPSLTRQSMIKRLELSEKSTKALAKFLDEIRSSTIIPKFRMDFGGSKAADFQLREISFSASMYAYVNMSMVDILSEEECIRLAKFLAEHLNHDAIELVESKKTFPNALWLPKK